MNRQPGHSILYGLDHVTFRRELFNSMPLPLRLAIFKKKVEALELESGFTQFDSNCVLDQLVNVEDIGMGHSVYLCSFTHRDIVVKHRPFDGQCLYMRLMAVMGWQTFDHYFYTNHFGPWEFFRVVRQSKL